MEYSSAYDHMEESAIGELQSELRQLREEVARLEHRVVTLEHAASEAATQAQPAPHTKPVPTPPVAASSPSARQAAYPSLRPYEAKPVYSSPQTPPPSPLPAVPAADLVQNLTTLPPAARIPQPSPAAPQPVPDAPPARSISLEERLGQNWLNKLGIVSLVIGIALFLGYQLRTLGPLGKSLVGLALSLFLLLGGLFLERQAKYRLFARAGIGGGWALTFFVAFALYHVDAMQVLHSQGADLVLMLLVAAGMVAHSLHYRSQVVTSLAFLLAFVTVGISHVTLFSLVAGALLAAALICVAYRERWFELALAGLIGAYFNHFLWLTRMLPDGGQPGHPFPDFYASAGLLLLYWLLFRLLYVLRVPLDDRQRLVSSLTAILNSAGMLLLLKYQSAHPEWTFRALLALGVVEWIFAFIGRTRWRVSFIVLSTIATAALLAAIPFRYSGAHWTILWLLEAQILFVAGVRMPETVFRRLGMAAWFLASFKILALDLIPIIDLRNNGPDASRHVPAAVTFFVAAVVFWFNSEFVTRRWKDLFAEGIDAGAMLLTSYLGAIMLSVGLWIFIPGAWTIMAWLALSLALSYTARVMKSADLASQADLLALAALLRIAVINFNLQEPMHAGHFGVRALTVTLAAALLYAGMGRRTSSHTLPAAFVPAIYSWAASILLAILAWYELPPQRLAIAWGIFALILFELGTLLRRPFLRFQGYTLLAVTFARMFAVDLNLFGDQTAETGWHPSHHRVYTAIPLVAAYLWVYERARRALAESEIDQLFGIIAAWLGLVATGALLYCEVAPERLAIAWSALAMLLLYVAWVLRRPIFAGQSLTVLAAATVDSMLFHLVANAQSAPSFWTSRRFFVGAACGIMFLSLPAAFGIRRRRSGQETPSAGAALLLTRPEQPFFFVPLVLIALLMAVELHGGRITVGWIALGLAAFLSALPIGERSYRLGGLSLLMLGLAKIVAIDIWSASPTDRYLTLIVTGAALLLVSFLYSRYKETILKFL